MLQVVASAHIENYAMKLFLAADKLDRAANFGKNVVKMFYSAGVLFDILETFGELPPEASHYRWVLSSDLMCQNFNVTAFWWN